METFMKDDSPIEPKFLPMPQQDEIKPLKPKELPPCDVHVFIYLFIYLFFFHLLLYLFIYSSIYFLPLGYKFVQISKH